MQRVALGAYITLANRFRQLRDRGTERGLTTTEIAVLTFVLVATASVIGFALYQYAQGQVDALPDNPAPDIPLNDD